MSGTVAEPHPLRVWLDYHEQQGYIRFCETRNGIDYYQMLRPLPDTETDAVE
jgi:hypothetical protein